MAVKGGSEFAGEVGVSEVVFQLIFFGYHLEFREQMTGFRFVRGKRRNSRLAIFRCNLVTMSGFHVQRKRVRV